jgi:putative NADH-flavin reductase
MHILIIGANGGIGKNSVIQALEAGHKVSALVRKRENITLNHPNLTIKIGDVMQSETLDKCLEGADVVLSSIGVKKLGPTTLYSEGNKNLLRTMKRTGVQRAFFISASAIVVSPVQPFFVRLLTKYVLQRILRHPYADQRIMETMIKESGINWTIMRPPRLTDKPVTGHYRVACNCFLKNSLSISRADVAHFMINNINNEATYKAIVEIGY